MAEAVAVISFVSAVVSLAEYGTNVVKRLNDFRSNVHDLPQTFLHISDQLPLLTDTVNRLHSQAKDGHLSPEAETVLRPVVDGIHAQLKLLDSVLVKTTHNGDLIKTLIDLIEQMNSSQLQDVQVSRPKKPHFMVRYQRDLDFVGREEIMEEIKQRFSSKNRVAIAGIGGVGKSRIAIEYYYQHKTNNPIAHVFWVHGGNKARFEAAYQDIARTMKIPAFSDPKINTLRLVSDWLSDADNGSWLMVLDNAGDTEVWIKPAIQESSQQDGLYPPAPLIDYIPRGSHCFVLITTRDSQLGERLAEVKRERPINVPPFIPKDAESLLRKKLPENDDITQEDANEITEALDCLPLAITQAAAYLDAKLYRYLKGTKSF